MTSQVNGGGALTVAHRKNEPRMSLMTRQRSTLWMATADNLASLSLGVRGEVWCSGLTTLMGVVVRNRDALARSLSV